jgi:hypothetical protein
LIIKKLRFSRPYLKNINYSDIPTNIRYITDKAKLFLLNHNFDYIDSIELNSMIISYKGTYYCDIYYNHKIGIQAVVTSLRENAAIMYASYFEDDTSLETVNRHFDQIIAPNSKTTIVNEWFQNDEETLIAHLRHLSASKRRLILDMETVLENFRNQYLATLDDWTNQGFMKFYDDCWRLTWSASHRWYRKVRNINKRPKNVLPFYQ